MNPALQRQNSSAKTKKTRKKTTKKICEVCGKRFLGSKKLTVHMSKFHNAKKLKEVYRKTMQQFFPLLEERKWSSAEDVAKQMEKIEVNPRWMMGYTNALIGMITGLRDRISSAQPYILEAKEYSREELLKERVFFKEAVRKGLSSRFDRGYFQAWSKYLDYQLSK